MTIDSRLAGILPERSAEDIFAGRVRLTFAGQVYELPTLVIEEEEKWLTRIDAQLAGILAGVASSGEDYGAIVGLLTGASPQLLDLIYAYDRTHVLPAREELRRIARSSELIRAVLEVWVAANPLLGIGLFGLQQANLPKATAPTNGHSPEPTSSPPPPGAGRRRKSGRP